MSRGPSILRSPLAWSRTAVLAAALLLLWVSTGKAQEPPPLDPVTRFGETVEVQVVNVPVYVTRNGEPVTDLHREDFELFEDGKRIVLTNFFVYLPEPQPAPETQTFAVEEEDQISSQIQEGGSASEPLFVVVYVDNLNLRPHTRKLMLDRLETFIEKQLEAKDPVMIVSAGHRLRIRHEFHTDREATRQVLAEIAKEPALGVREDQQLSRILNEITWAYTDALAGELDASRIAGDLRNEAEAIIGQARGTLGMLTDLVGSLGEVPGRKVVLHLSDGISNLGDRPQMTHFLAKANANRVTFYTIDGGGSRQFGINQAQQHAKVRDGWSVEQAQGREDDREQSLRTISGETGGKMLFARKNMDRELDEFRAAVDTYYSVGFSPTGNSAHSRKIRVKVKGRGLKLRYPKTYRFKSPEERLYEQVLAALRVGVTDNNLGASIHFGAAKLDGETYVVPIQVRVPLRSLVLIPSDSHQIGSLTLMYAVQDAGGKASDVRLGALPIGILDEEMEEAAGMDAAFEVVLAMAPTASRIAFTVRDDVGRTTSTVKKDFRLIDRR